jgi:tryptophan synthase alpha chain
VNPSIANAQMYPQGDHVTMNRIAKTFVDLKNKQEKALVGFVTAGDPDRPRSLELIKGMCAGGLDILELGVPFSDPTADGPVIQRSSQRALSQGLNLKQVLEMVAEIRQFSSIPMILFSYYNPILRMGAERFYRLSISAGADGVLLVDLPPEESSELTSAWPGRDLDLIRLIAPTTPPQRMAKIAAGASGFLYLVSKTGVTGSDGLNSKTVSDSLDALYAVSDLPICVGFGISTTRDVARIAALADGVVIGSAFERVIEENLTHPGLAGLLQERVSQYKAATRAPA